MSTHQNDIQVVAMYQFTQVDDPRELRDKLFAFAEQESIRGIMIIAGEGLNGTMAGEPEHIRRFVEFVKSMQGFEDIVYKTSYCDSMPFLKLKIKVKKEIVTFGIDGIDPNSKTGDYVNPEQWNELISDPEVTLVDTRNYFEYMIGTFQGAENPETRSFGEFPEYVEKNLDPSKNKKVAMFCTGGIRCEKASAYLLQQGFEKVYQLHGGILKYLEDVDPNESMWKGECFVFDERMTVDHNLRPGNGSVYEEDLDSEELEL
jgi:UPF0176 protein